VNALTGEVIGCLVSGSGDDLDLRAFDEIASE